MDHSRIKFFHYDSNFFGVKANQTLECCFGPKAWEQKNNLIFGKEVRISRPVVAYGNNNINYNYSKFTHKGNVLTQPVCNLLEKFSSHLGIKFIHPLLNLYRYGNDSAGWHKYDKKDLGDIINAAIVSLGISRIFTIRHPQTESKISIVLDSNRLILMQPPLQFEWEQCLRKISEIKDVRMTSNVRNVIERKTK